MKSIAFVLLTIMFVSCTENNVVSVGNKTTMEVEKVFDAGNVVKGEMVTARFNLKNTGDYPLVLAEVKASCSCTVAEYDEEPLSPGESMVLMAHVNTDKTGTGIVNKSVRIVANTEPSITQVMIKANVTAR